MTRPVLLRLATLLVLAVPAVAAAQPVTAPSISAEARAYLTTALDSLQATSLRRDATDWTAVRDSAFTIAAGAQRPDQTYGAINWALQRVDPHSFLQARFPWVNPELVADRVGYVRVPYHPVRSPASLADTLQNALRHLDAQGACGWIVDLRKNGGGNVWPMIAGVGPLLGDSLVAVTLADGRPASRTVYANGASVEVGADGTRTAYARATDPYMLRHPDAPVAVLIDRGTGSSGEGIAIAFRTRAATRFFGQPTAGYTTANRGVQLADGANMVVTVDPMTYRDGREYIGPIEPDERVSQPDAVWPTSVDVVSRRAMEWLLQQPGCSAE